MDRWIKVIVIFSVIGIVGVALSLIAAVWGMGERIAVRSAMWQVTDMIVMYTQEHQRAPRSWEDLNSTYDAVNQGYNSLTVDDLKGMINVDFRRIGQFSCGEDSHEQSELLRFVSARQLNMRSKLRELQHEVNTRISHVLCER